MRVVVGGEGGYDEWMDEWMIGWMSEWMQGGWGVRGWEGEVV